MMRVGVDARVLRGDLTGIGQYALELCRHLEESLPSAELVAYSPWRLNPAALSKRWTVRLDSLFSASSPSRLLMYLWPVVRVGALCRADRLDAYWAVQAPFIPNLGKRVNVVATVYDLHYKVAPKTLGGPARALFRLFEGRYRYARALVAISRGTSEHLKVLLGRRATAIVRPAVDKRFGPLPASEIERRLRLYGIRKPYILTVASWDPRKNLDLLVRVFTDMKRQGPAHGLSLVLVGRKGGRLRLNRALESLLQERATDAVQTTGYLPDEDLPALYGGAEAFIFPSLYEGFGLPVAEALACGTRVVASNLPELREAGGEHPTYVEPTAEGIRSGILAVLTDARPRVCVQPAWTWREGAETMARLLLDEPLPYSDQPTPHYP